MIFLQFFEWQLQFLQLLTRHFNQSYERVYITTIRYIFPTIRIPTSLPPVDASTNLHAVCKGASIIRFRHA